MYCFTTNLYPKFPCHHLDTVHHPYLSLSRSIFALFLSIHIINILFWKNKARKQSKLFKHFFSHFESPNSSFWPTSFSVMCDLWLTLQCYHLLLSFSHHFGILVSFLFLNTASLLSWPCRSFCRKCQDNRSSYNVLLITPLDLMQIWPLQWRLLWLCLHSLCYPPCHSYFFAFSIFINSISPIINLCIYYV